jgi:hypothetical protein
MGFIQAIAHELDNGAPLENTYVSVHHNSVSFRKNPTIISEDEKVADVNEYTLTASCYRWVSKDARDAGKAHFDERSVTLILTATGFLDRPVSWLYAQLYAAFKTHTDWYPGTLNDI